MPVMKILTNDNFKILTNAGAPGESIIILIINNDRAEKCIISYNYIAIWCQGICCSVEASLVHVQAHHCICKFINLLVSCRYTGLEIH